jgi:hypothetical protein
MGNDDFGWALLCLKAGNKMARRGWNGKGMFLFCVSEWECQQEHYPALPFIAMKTADDKVVPWLASQTDLLAEDWELVD